MKYVTPDDERGEGESPAQEAAEVQGERGPPDMRYVCNHPQSPDEAFKDLPVNDAVSMGNLKGFYDASADGGVEMDKRYRQNPQQTPPTRDSFEMDGFIIRGPYGPAR